MRSISRKIVLSLLLMLLIVSTDTIIGKETLFDIKTSDWFYKDVINLSQKDTPIIQGYPDGSFRPNETLNKDQFITMIIRSLGYDFPNGQLYWAQGFIDQAISLGILEESNSTLYNRPITREEMSRYLLKAFEISNPGFNFSHSSLILSNIADDQQIQAIYLDAVANVYELGLITGYEDNTFRPKSFLNRAEAATILLRLIDPDKRQPYIAASPSNAQLGFGTNLAGPTDYGTEWPFNNIMKLARTWITQNENWVDGGSNLWDTDVLDQIPLDDNGYPLELPLTISGQEAPQILTTVWANTKHMLPGLYHLYYDGEGVLELKFDAELLSSEDGHITFNLSSDSNIAALEIHSSLKDNHIRNIRILHDSVNQKDTFNPYWLEKISAFNTLRFMDWGQTNNNPITKWSDRPLVDDYTFTTQYGIPYELMIEVCNTTQKNMWLCVPHAADDDYIQNLAQLIKDTLDPNLTVYVEYSNEVWNWMFDQTHDLFESGDQSQEWPERIVPFIQNTMDIFTDVFEDDLSRLNRVVGTQHHWIDVSNRIASNMRPDSFDTLSPAAYFGFSDQDYQQLAQAGKAANPEMIAAMVKDSIDQEAYPLMVEQAEIANRLGVAMAFYEGGQHLTPKPFGSEQAYGQALVDIQDSALIYDLYTYWFDQLSTIELNTQEPIAFINFSLASDVSAKYGTWGIFRSIYDEGPYKVTAPKYQAILDY